MSSLDRFDQSTRILVPVRLPDAEPLAPWLIDFIAPLDVYVVGCYLVKEQTSPEQARAQFEDQAARALDHLVAQFEAIGTEVTSKLVFTHDVVETIDRLENDLEIDVVITPTAAERISKLLVVITDGVHLDRLQRCISTLLEQSPVPVTLLHVADQSADEGKKEEKALLLDGLKQRLTDSGIDAERIETRSLEDEHPDRRTVEASSDFDLVVISETEKSIRDLLLREAPSPVIVVRPRSNEK